MSELTSDVAQLLVSLSANGARLRSGRDGIVLEVPTTATRQPISRQTVLRAYAEGFLHSTSEPNDGTATLSETGRAKLRELQTARQRPRSGSRTRRLAEAAHSRPMERRSLAEQLAQRRDGQGQALLAPVHVAAAERFCNDFGMAGLQPRVTQNWTAAPVRTSLRGAAGLGADLAHTVTAAQDRVRAALDSLGTTLADVVLDACAFEKGLERIEAERHWPRRSGRLMLRGALEQLALHYGLLMPQRRDKAILRLWADGGYQPSGNTQDEGGLTATQAPPRQL